MAAQSSNLAGWTGPKYQPANQEDEEKLMDQPPPYPLNPDSNLQYPLPPTLETQSLIVSGQVGPYTSNFSNQLQPPPVGWSLGPDQATEGSGNLNSQPDSFSVYVDNGEDKEESFSDKNIRRAFIRKVYAILMVQLLITGGIIALFLYEENIARFSQEHPEMMIVSAVGTLVLTIVLVCCDNCRRMWPMNFILLITFTVLEGWMLGTVCSFFEIDDVLIAAGICAAVCLALTIFAFQTKWDFTAMGGILLASLVILMMFGLFTTFYGGEILHLVYSALGALVFSFYLVYDTQMMIGGNHKYSLSPEEYIFAALSIYLDVIQLFLYILQMLGKRK